MITFASVTKKFGDTASGVDEISFVVSPGEMVIFTGPSGSGKTTLMRLLIKEYQPTSGEITFEGQSLNDLRGSEVAHHRRRIGVIFQDYKLLPDMNVWENIALPLSIVGKKTAEMESRVTDLLKLVNLTDKAHLFPGQLSGGEAQRISIARALATGPGVIFADEPTGNLDPETSVTIAKLLKKINKLGTTILFATHDTVVLDVLSSERRICLCEGKITSDSGCRQPKKAEAPVEKEPTEEKTHSKEKNDTDDEVKVEKKIEKVSKIKNFFSWGRKKEKPPENDSVATENSHLGSEEDQEQAKEEE